MQTFLPYANFTKCAEVLDDKRLWKQIVECKQLLNTIKGKSKGWIHHPVTKMWGNYPEALTKYMIAMFEEWHKRRFQQCFEMVIDYRISDDLLPSWLGDEELHLSHRLNLLYKDPKHYGQYFDEPVPTKKPEYVWKVV